MNDIKIKIGEIDTTPQIDPYNRDTGQSTGTVIRIDPTDGEVSVYQEGHTNSTSEAAWNGRILEFSITAHPSENRMREILKECEADLQVIIDGLSVCWDGHNHVGTLNEEASSKYGRLVEYFEEVVEDEEYYEFWMVDDWLRDGLTITGTETDEELKALADQFETQRDSNVILEGDILEYLTIVRDEKAQDF